ncbi:MAG: hypothetical protein ACK5BR_03375 [Bacteroidota bacterium]|jgi:hypothetical protein|nr:hypothetical protein [Algoriphagus sp.]
MKKYLFRSSIFIAIIFSIFSCGKENAEVQKLETKVEEKAPTPLPVVSEEFNRVALFLSGLPQVDSNYYSQLEKKEFWKLHEEQMKTIWEKAEGSRLSLISSWTEKSLIPKIKSDLPLYYPFAGADFLHAWYFYPNAPAYHLVALENVSKLPEFEKMSDDQFTEYLSSLRNSLRDVIGKSYFITMHMQTDLRSGNYSGILPLYFVFLSRTGHKLLNLETIEIDSLGNHKVTDNKNFPGVRIKMTKDGFNEKELTYMKFDLGNDNLVAKQEYNKWVASLGEKNVFLKAASYLLHYNSFEEARNSIFSNTSSIFQDDSGIAYRYIDSTKFETNIFGEYTRPIKDFGDHTFQKDLESLYLQTPQEKRPTIPFPLGYHVVADKIQNHQLFIRKN